MNQEPIKHKALDRIVVLSLLGFSLIARIEIYRPGHTINHQITRTLRQAFWYTLNQSIKLTGINAAYSNA